MAENRCFPPSHGTPSDLPSPRQLPPATYLPQIFMLFVGASSVVGVHEGMPIKIPPDITFRPVVETALRFAR